MRICNIIYPIGALGGVASLFAGAIVIQTSYGWGLFLCCFAVFLALIAGTAQVLEAYLHAEDMYRITGRRPRKKNEKRTMSGNSPGCTLKQLAGRAWKTRYD